MIWKDKVISWKDPSSWVPLLSRWLRPFLNKRGISHLRKMGEQDICFDDESAWLIAQTALAEDVDAVIQLLHDALGHSRLRTYHACRVKDASVYHDQGIRRNDPRALAELARSIIMEEEALAWMRPTIDEKIKNFDATERDTGKLYVVLDDRFLIKHAGHYLIYGSEWIQGFLGWSAHDVLRKRGVPTIILIDLPLVCASSKERLAQVFMREWTRVIVNKPDWVPEIDFSFCLWKDVPKEWVVGHYHPAAVPDCFYERVERRTEITFCPCCKN